MGILREIPLTLVTRTLKRGSTLVPLGYKTVTERDMRMKLFANGCSFTWGGGILEEERGLSGTLSGPIDDVHVRFRESSVWPARLDELLGNTGHINLGMGCGSNSRIVRTTLDYFISKQCNGDDISDHIAVIQWTDPSRYEIYDTDLRSWLLIKSDVVIPYVDSYRYDNLQMRLAEDQINYNNDMFNCMVCLSGFFDRWGIRYMFTSMMPMPFDQPYQHRYCADKMNWFMDAPSRNLGTVIPEQRFKYGSGHPNLNGHARIAEVMHEQMRNLGWC